MHELVGKGFTMSLLNRKIFLIEDNLTNRAIAQIALESAGATTEIERWGTDAITKIRDFMPVDIILLDLMFPRNVSGYDVFMEIRKNDDLKHIPIVAVSAADASTAMQKTQEMGFDGFIAKPIDIDQFPKQIETILSGESLWIKHSF